MGQAVPGTPSIEGIPVVHGPAVCSGEDRGGDVARVDETDAQRRLCGGRRDEPALHGEGPDAGQHVAAGLGRADDRFADDDLQEEVVEVDARPPVTARRSPPCS